MPLSNFRVLFVGGPLDGGVEKFNSEPPKVHFIQRRKYKYILSKSKQGWRYVLVPHTLKNKVDRKV